MFGGQERAEIMRNEKKKTRQVGPPPVWPNDDAEEAKGAVCDGASLLHYLVHARTEYQQSSQPLGRRCISFITVWIHAILARNTSQALVQKCSCTKLATD